MSKVQEKRSGFPFMVLLVLLVGVWWSAHRASILSRYRESRQLMGTVVHMDVCYAKGQESAREAAYQAVWARMKDINERMNVFNAQGDVAKINQSYGNPVVVGEDTHKVVATALKYSQITYGSFDITVWPLIKLWKAGQEKNQIPSSKEIHQAQDAVGSDRVQLLKDQIAVLHPETKVDLGGIAAGYAVDEAARIFRAHGLEQFFIDAGGDIYVGGKNCQNRPWRIGIRNPQDTSQILEIVELENMAITTSGDYEKFYEIQGERWSHIMNPITGYPEREVTSATMIAPTTIEADALATALCVLSPTEGTALVNSMGEDRAALILTHEAEGKVARYESSRYSSWVANPQP